MQASNNMFDWLAMVFLLQEGLHTDEKIFVKVKVKVKVIQNSTKISYKDLSRVLCWKPDLL